MKAIRRIYVYLLIKIDSLSALSVRLVKLTGKHTNYVHPKHLIKSGLWFKNYLKKDDLVLDIGCGIGQLAIDTAQNVKKVIGTDIDRKAIKIARESAKERLLTNIQFMIHDSNKKLPFQDKYFDKIIANDILEHLIKREFALKEIKRVLKKDGYLFLVCDNPDTSWKKQKKSVGFFYYADLDHKYEYSKQEIIKLLTKHKFEVLRISTVTYDTPLKGLIDLSGGISLALYKRLRKWRMNQVKKHPQETTGFRILAKI